MAASGAEFFTMNEVNRLKVTQDVFDRRLTTHLVANVSAFPTSTVAASSNTTAPTTRCTWLVAGALGRATTS